MGTLFATSYEFCSKKGHHSQKQLFCGELCWKKEFLDDLVDGGYTTRIGPQVGPDWNQADTIDIMDGKWPGALRVNLVGLNDKWQITAVFCESLVGAFLPIKLIYRVKQMMLSKIGFH